MEQQLIKWMKERVLSAGCAQTSEQIVLLGIGDDGAIVSGGPAKAVHVADAIVDQVHFDLAVHPLRLIGRKALAINLSDIAAMGAVAETALITFVLPKSLDFESAKELFEGIIQLAIEFNVAIIGGDTVRHDGPLMINVAAAGKIDADSNCPFGWRMDSAKIGDIILITGPLGGSILGSHLSFQPRLTLAREIQKRVAVNSATDISDSLSIDLSHVLSQSGAGAEFELDKIPVHEDATTLSGTSGKSPVEHVLEDGEDFELLLTMAVDSWEALNDDESFTFELHPIGRVVDRNIGKIMDAATGLEIATIGFEH